MSQPRYSEALQVFIRAWRPNNPELDQRFMEDVTKLLAAILRPPTDQFEVQTILTPKGGVVVARVGEYEVQFEPVQAHHLALSLIEAAASARIESFLMRFLGEKLQAPDDIAARMVGEFRNYRVEEMENELAGDLAKQGTISKDRK